MEEELKKEVDRLRKSYWATAFSFILLASSSLFFMMITLDILGNPLLGEIDTTNEVDEIAFYKNLSLTEEVTSRRILNRIRPEFLVGQKSITIIKHNKNVPCDSEDGYPLAGCNSRGRITVVYDSDSLRFREVICHELLHTYLNHVHEEVIVDILEEKWEVCFR